MHPPAAGVPPAGVPQPGGPAELHRPAGLGLHAVPVPAAGRQPGAGAVVCSAVVLLATVVQERAASREPGQPLCMAQYQAPHTTINSSRSQLTSASDVVTLPPSEY